MPTGPAVDDADILPPDDEARLDQQLRNYWNDNQTAIVVASVPSLEGQSIEQQATLLFNSWDIGDPETNRGLLILIAPTERQMRIEVGCGLETVITNAVAKTIIDNDMIPLFALGQYVHGVEAGVDALTDQLIDSADAGPASPFCIAAMREAA